MWFRAVVTALLFCFIPIRLLSFQFTEADSLQVIKWNKELSKLIYSDTLKADSVGQLALNTSLKLEFAEGEARSNRLLGFMNLLNGNLAKSKEFYERNLELSLNSDDDLWKGKAYLALTEVTKRQGDQVLTLDYLLESVSYVENSNDRATLGKAYALLGSYHRQYGDLKTSENNYRKALEVRLELADSAGVFNTYQTLGSLYASDDDYELARTNFLMALSFLDDNTRAQSVASLYSNLGSTYLKEKQLDSAEFYYQLSLKKQELLGNKYSQTLLLNNLAALNFEQGNYRESNRLAEKGVALATEIEARKLLSSLYFNMSDNHNALGDYKQSFHYYKLSDSIDYEITNEEKNRQLAEFQVQYDTEKKDNEILQQNLDLAVADSQRKLLFAGLGLLMVIAAFTYGLLIRKRKSNQALQLQKALVEKREKEKALLLRELHHRVKNNFQIVSSLLNLQYYDAQDKETAQAIKSGQARVEAMSMIHRELYQSENITTIEMQDYVVHLIDNTAYSFNFDSNEFDTELNISHEPLGVKYAIPLGVIINELITNAFKHAFTAVDRPMLGVVLNIDTINETVTLRLWDNGPGIPDSAEIKETSFGLELIHDLVSQLKGKLTIEGQVVLEFPYQPQEAYVES